MNESIFFKVIFPKDRLTNENLTFLFRELLFFDPKVMCGKKLTSGKARKYNQSKFFEGFEKEISVKGAFTLYLDDGDMHHLTVYRGHFMAAFSGFLSPELYESVKDKLVDTLNRAFKLFGGHVGFMCSSVDNFWQSYEYLDYYRMQNKPVDHLPKKQSPIFKKEQIVDIEYNPGHTHFVKELWFGSCWMMWFGEPYFELIPKRVLQSVTGCHVNEEIEGGAVRIVLYDNPWKYEKPENRAIQWKFRRSVGIDEVAHSLLEEPPTIVTDADPFVEIFTGEFPNGGVRLIQHYQNAFGEAVSKSQAVKRYTLEVSESGTVVWSEEAQL